VYSFCYSEISPCCCTVDVGKLPNQVNPIVFFFFFFFFFKHYITFVPLECLCEKFATFRTTNWYQSKVSTRPDNGSEYISDSFLKICQDDGIIRHFTVSGTPQQNGVAERMNRTILEKV